MIAEYDTVIVGGGIVGAGIFRDLSLHNISTLIIDKYDFSAKTSQKSSKMLHGGIRYLENMDFELVYEALHEKNLWLKIAPHLCFEERFYLPVYENAKRPLWMIKIGLFLYDLLSGFQNTLHETKNHSETLKAIPILNPKGLKGAGIYSDAIVDDAKMTLEMIYDGLRATSSHALNYHELVEDKPSLESHILKIKNTLTHELIQIKCKNVIYATGPFTDQLLKTIPNYHWKEILLPSKGSHLWFLKKDIPISHPIVMTTNNDRVIFVIPQNDLVLVGTTEIQTNEDFFNTEISENEIKYLLNMLNLYFPTLNLAHNHIQGSFAGIRPLVKENDSTDLGKTSREHKIIQPMDNVYVIAGGKYTTFRVMGQEITRNIVMKKGRSYNSDFSKSKILRTSHFPSFQFHLPSDDELKTICKNELPKTFIDLVERRLGINSKKIWNEKSPILFDTFFESKIQLLKPFIQISLEEIKNFH